ncbi:MAG: amino acid permease [Candidatus Zapsychrus exili]|nr:amino acid permease [Candidatus Zapsychrus exili]
MTTKRFSTFEGVFTPCLLSILGVIMYLRLGWVVGNAGLGGAILIIVLANFITLATALSMSSVVTNIRIGAGGAYSIIAKSLGLEAGGAIGIPLYISQAISVAFYIAGFSECWRSIFPTHSILLISLIVWLALLIVSYLSAKLAFRIQYIIMMFIVLSIVSIVLGKPQGFEGITLFNSTSSSNFWQIFAIFFPAVTGILVGASMSGELKDPRRAIPVGTISAMTLSFFMYIFLAYCFATKASALNLQNNLSVAIDTGRWQWMVIAGIMGATLSSALSMFVSAPRVFLALGKHDNLPFSKEFTHINDRGEPTVAILFTALIALTTILFGSLDKIAGLLTMFFLVTYGMINLTVFIEQSMGIASFRPTFRVNKIMPLLGSVGCVIIMFLINVKFSFIALLVIVFMYWLLLKRGTRFYSPDIRSGILVFFAEKFARMANALPYYPKIWKPNLLIPTEDIDNFSSITNFIENIVSPAGRIKVYKMAGLGRDLSALDKRLSESVESLKEHNIFVETTVVESMNMLSTATTVIQTLKGMFFPPNTFFYALKENINNDTLVKDVIVKASSEDLGVILLDYDKKVGFAQEQIINVWIREGSPNIGLSILIAIQLQRNWEGTIRILQVVNNEYDKENAVSYLEKLKNLMRISQNVEIEVLVGGFMEVLKEAPLADVNIFGMPEVPDISLIRKIKQDVRTSVLFLRDSKYENVFA